MAKPATPTRAERLEKARTVCWHAAIALYCSGTKRKRIARIDLCRKALAAYKREMRAAKATS